MKLYSSLDLSIAMYKQLAQFTFLARYFSHDPPQFLKVVKMAIASIEGGIEKIKSGSAAKDLKLVRDGYHTLKGNLTNVELGHYIDQIPSYDSENIFELSIDYANKVEEELQSIKVALPKVD